MSDPNNTAEWLSTLSKDRNRGSRSWYVTFALSITLGWLGADRLYLGYYALGFLKALTVGGLFVWWIFDLLLILTDNMTDVEGNYLKR